MQVRINGFANTRRKWHTAPPEKQFKGQLLEAVWDGKYGCYKAHTPLGPLHIHPQDVDVVESPFEQ